MTQIPIIMEVITNMRFLVIDEANLDEMEKMLKNRDVHAEARKKGELPTLFLPDHALHGDLPQLTQNMRAIKIYETDDPQQITNVSTLYAAIGVKTWNRWVIPITESSHGWTVYEKYKKKVK